MQRHAARQHPRRKHLDQRPISGMKQAGPRDFCAARHRRLIVMAQPRCRSGQQPGARRTARQHHLWRHMTPTSKFRNEASRTNRPLRGAARRDTGVSPRWRGRDANKDEQRGALRMRQRAPWSADCYTPFRATKTARSANLQLYPHSLSYQASTFTIVSSITIVLRLSKMALYGEPLKSMLTSGSVQY